MLILCLFQHLLAPLGSGLADAVYFFLGLPLLLFDSVTQTIHLGNERAKVLRLLLEEARLTGELLLMTHVHVLQGAGGRGASH